MMKKFISYDEFVIASLAICIAGGLIWLVLQKYASAFCIVLFATIASFFNRRYLKQTEKRRNRKHKDCKSCHSAMQLATEASFMVGIMLSFILSYA